MKNNIFSDVIAAFGEHLYAPIFRLGDNEFCLLYTFERVQPTTLGFACFQDFSFGTTPGEAFQIGQLCNQGAMPHLEGAQFIGKVFYLLDENNENRRFGFCGLPSAQEQRAVMILLSGPLWEESEGAPKPDSGESPKMAIATTPLILRGL